MLSRRLSYRLSKRCQVTRRLSEIAYRIHPVLVPKDITYDLARLHFLTRQKTWMKGLHPGRNFAS